jgi:hypothetical protein
MSRSRKKNPITGVTTAKSEKIDKKIYNKKMRRKKISDERPPPHKREVSNKWLMSKDGKVNWKGTNFEDESKRK